MTAQDVIRMLQLQPHPKEYGYFRETYRSSFSTAIYFLVTKEGMSEMHRLTSDEVFHFYTGAPAEVLLLDPNEQISSVTTLGSDLEAGQAPQLVIPKGIWQGLRTTGEFTLIGCTVAPPFEYKNYEAGNRDELIKRFPAYADRIMHLTKSTEARNDGTHGKKKVF